MNLILFGPPGAGKGTQSKYLVNKLKNYQISTGDMLREEIKNNSEIGKKIIKDMDDGKFINDEIVNNLIKNTLSDPKKRNKLIFDGYPRSIDQSKHLDLILKRFNQKVDLIISLSVPREIIEKRIAGRITCDKCNLTLNEFFNESEKLDIDIKSFGENKFFYDVIYNPKETEFLKDAKSYGNIVENGKMMFIYQAHQAFSVWHKIFPEIDNEVIKIVEKCYK